MDAIESTEFIEVMKEQEDYDVVHRVGQVFGFTTFGSKQKWDPRKLFQCKKKKIEGSITSIQQIEEQEAVKSQRNFYEKLSLVRCFVNVFAMKKFIRNNIKSLREIFIEDCKFYLSDDDASEQKNQVINQRMLQELNFVWLIEQFKFQDIMFINIKLLKEVYGQNSTTVKLRNLYQRMTQRILSKNQNKKALQRQQTQNNEVPVEETFTKDELIEIFDCKEDCNFMNYELAQKQYFERKFTPEYLKSFTQDLIWGDVQDQERFIDKLYDNTLNDIQQNLAIYKKFTKYSFNDGKLVIIGDVMYNGMSLNQLYNLIQLTCKDINGIIFKDNGKIPPKAFSDLMKQIFLIPKLEQITFLSSVLDESSLYELQYLIVKKQVKFLNLYRSYFLKSELIELMGEDFQVKINHQRFIVIDITQKKSFEFTPYAFNTDEMKRKKREEMLEVERVYRQQMYYPKQVYNQIVFFQGMNLSIVNLNGSEKILFKYWDLLNLKPDELQSVFQQKQEILLKILESQFREDDINVLNYSLIKLLIKQVIEEEGRKTFENMLNNSKSFKLLKESFEIKAVEKVKFRQLAFLQNAYSYLYGFTRIKVIKLVYIIKNEKLFTDVRDDNPDYLKVLNDRDQTLTLQESFSDQPGDEPTVIGIMKNIGQFLDFEHLKELVIESQTTLKSFLFLNYVLPRCKVLKKMSLYNNMINDEKLQGVNFSLVSSTLESFDIGANKNIENYDFLHDIFNKAKNLKNFLIQSSQLLKYKIEHVNFALIPSTVEEVDLSFNPVTDVTHLNMIFANAPNLKKVNLSSCAMVNETFKQIKFGTALKELNLNFNQGINLNTGLIHLGLQEGLELESLEAYTLAATDKFPEDCMQYLQPGSLKAFSKLKKLHVQRNRFTQSEYVNLALNNISSPTLTDFKLTDQSIPTAEFVKLTLTNVYPSLEILDLSYGHSLTTFTFLNDIFQQAVKLKVLKLNFSSVLTSKMNNVNMSTIPATLEEFQFSGNVSFDSYDTLLNPIFEKCQGLKKLIITQANLTDQKISKVDFFKIPSKLEVFDFSNNDKLTNFNFLNIVFKTAVSLKQIILNKLKIGKTHDILFDLLNKSLEVFRAEQEDDNFFTEEFQDWLVSKMERGMNLRNFQQKYSNLDNYSSINYFGVFEYYNLSQFRSSLEVPKQKKEELKPGQEAPTQKVEDVDKDLKKDLDLKEKKNKLKQEEEEERNKRKEQNSQWALKHNMKPLDNWVESSRDVNYQNQMNPNFFYSLMKKIDQLVEEENPLKKDSKSKMNLAVLIEKIVEFQNAYSNKEYLFLQLSDQKSLREQYSSSASTSALGASTLDHENLFKLLKEVNLANQKHENLDFFSFILNNCSSIQKIDMSNMGLTQEILLNISIPSLPTIQELNFSGNKCTETNLFTFINQLIQNVPNLLRLNLSNMDMNQDSICDFSLVSSTLQELNISNNKRFPSLQLLNDLFTRCTDLRKLNISAIGLKKTKIDGSSRLISPILEEFDCSDNDQLDTIDFLNDLINRCRSLIKLSFKNCKLDYTKNRNIQYYSLPPTLKELDISGNVIIYFMEFLEEITEGATNLVTLNMGNQITNQQYDTLNEGVFPNTIENFDFSGNSAYNVYNFIPELILKSSKFKRLTVQNINLSVRRLEFFRFQDCGRCIQELDISNNSNVTSIKPLNFIAESPNFVTFIANKTNLNNILLKELDITKLFRNIKRFEFADNIQMLRYEFMNELFSTAKQLEVLNLSGLKFTQAQIEQIDFSLVPPTLQEINLSKNENFTNFKFLNQLFISTKDSLKKISLSQCKMTEAVMEVTDFSLISKIIETIDISENEDLKSINFMEKMFQNNPTINLKTLNITKITFDTAFVLQKYCSQIEKIDCPSSQIDFSFFSKNKFTVNINSIKFLQYLFSNFKSSSFLKRSKSQMMFEGSDNQGKIFKQFLQYLMEFKSDQKPLQTLVHFLFLILNEEKLLSKKYPSKLFIMSPFSFFLQDTDINCEYNEEKKPKLIIDSFNLAFFDLCLMNKRTEYIFAYDKFFFHDFPDFYVQSFPEKHSDLKFIIELKKKMDQHLVSNAFLPIRLQLTPQALKEVQLSEFEVLYLVNFIPPSTMNLKGMSIQFVKSWYAINFFSPLSVNTLIDVDYELLENSSIANFITLYSYRLYVSNFEGKTFTSKLKMLFGSACYSFFNVLSSQPQQYRFDHTVIHLENRFKGYVAEGKHNYLRVLFPIYLFVCIFGVWFFSYDSSVTCGSNLSWYSYLTYAIFGIVTFSLEAYIFNECLNYVKHLVPELKPDCRISFPYPLINSIKLFIMDVWWINQWYVNYTVSFLLSQLSRFDFFTNIGFLFTTYSCGDYLIFTLALISLSITTFTNIVFFILNFTGADTYGRLVTGQIDKLYQICNLLEFQAVADVLDIISPSNSVTIAGKMFNQRIINNFIRIIFQDIPFIIIQAIYLVSKGTFKSSTIFSIVSSGLMFLVSLKKFLTITPSRLGQEDFNELNEIKKNRVLPNYLNKLQQYESQITSFNFYETLKCIKSTNYFSRCLSRNHSLTANEINKQLQMARDLRQFQPNQDSIQSFFGNNSFNDTISVSLQQRNLNNQKSITMKGADIPLADVESLSNSSKKSQQEMTNLIDREKQKSTISHKSHPKIEEDNDHDLSGKKSELALIPRKMSQRSNTELKQKDNQNQDDNTKEEKMKLVSHSRSQSGISIKSNHKADEENNNGSNKEIQVIHIKPKSSKSQISEEEQPLEDKDNTGADNDSKSPQNEILEKQEGEDKIIQP